MGQMAHVEAERFVCKMRGGSQPILIQADDGEFYIVKFFVNMQGPLVVINEVLGSTIYRDAGLTVPVWRLVKITDKFLNANPEAWFHFRDQQLRPCSGYAFGSRLAGGGGRLRAWELLSGEMYATVSNRSQFWPALALDILFGQTDFRQAVFVQAGNGSLLATFIDFGSDYRLPETWEDRQRVLACRYSDMRVYPNLSPEIADQVYSTLSRINVKSLERVFSSLPFAWKQGQAIERYIEIVSKIGSKECRSKAASLVLASGIGGIQPDRPAEKLRDRWNRHFTLQSLIA
jgi:hypothetical protein